MEPSEVKEFKQSIQDAVISVCANEVKLLDELAEEALIKYEKAITLYKNGYTVNRGWYEFIRELLLGLDVNPRSAHVLSYIRDEIQPYKSSLIKGLIVGIPDRS